MGVRGRPELTAGIKKTHPLFPLNIIFKLLKLQKKGPVERSRLKITGLPSKPCVYVKLLIPENDYLPQIERTNTPVLSVQVVEPLTHLCQRRPRSQPGMRAVSAAGEKPKVTLRQRLHTKFGVKLRFWD